MDKKKESISIAFVEPVIKSVAKSTDEPKLVSEITLKVSTVRNQNILHFKSMFDKLKYPLPVYRTGKAMLYSQVPSLLNEMDKVEQSKKGVEIVGYINSPDDIEWNTVSGLLRQEQLVNEQWDNSIRDGFFLKAKVTLDQPEPSCFYKNFNLIMGTLTQSHGVVNINSDLCGFYLVNTDELILSNKERFEKIVSRIDNKTKMLFEGWDIPISEMPTDIEKHMDEIKAEILAESPWYDTIVATALSTIIFGTHFADDRNSKWLTVNLNYKLNDFVWGQIYSYFKSNKIKYDIKISQTLASVTLVKKD